MSHQYEAEKRSYVVIRDISILALLFLVLGCGITGLVVDMQWQSSQDERLLAVAEEQEALLDIIKIIYRYEAKTVPRLPRSLRHNSILADKTLLKPLEERIRQRMALLENVARQLKEQQ